MAQNSIVKPIQLIVIGGSAGSLDVILKLMPALAPSLPVAILIVTHRKASSEDLLVDLLNSRGSWPVREAEEKEPVAPHAIYVAPSDYHLLIEKDFTFSLDVSEKVNYSRPSIDITFESAAEVYGEGLVAILLSGANADGVAGMKRVRSNGGTCVVQDPSTAEVSYMPAQAIEQGLAHHILPAEEMAAFINGLFTNDKNQ
ncbi:chemotaxis protein CheB [Paraflavitalea sp. CAU 1676]|uniref:chemotaxis protein CheB n=1 Tax=Paraflavitalea sp. CAU 1676 TaxID=3032598 RepID=UPI0023DC0732|nr:chemotaxis protein CheB [Paraflavitalea sp. CAU 1676]MDF2188170.1 chemotaxis protein CheB [Paraflavitalea sp. CAU 1676]